MIDKSSRKNRARRSPPPHADIRTCKTFGAARVFEDVRIFGPHGRIRKSKPWPFTPAVLEPVDMKPRLVK